MVGKGVCAAAVVGVGAQVRGRVEGYLGRGGWVWVEEGAGEAEGDFSLWVGVDVSFWSGCFFLFVFFFLLFPVVAGV